MFERSCLRQHRLFTFVRHYASSEVSCGMLTKLYINSKLFETFVFSPLSAHCKFSEQINSVNIFTGCSQGGKVPFENGFRNMLCSFKASGFNVSLK